MKNYNYQENTHETQSVISKKWVSSMSWALGTLIGNGAFIMLLLNGIAYVLRPY